MECSTDGLYIRKLLNTGNRKTREKSKTAAALEMYISDLENKLTSELGRRIKINNGLKKGRIEIEYYDNNDLEKVINALLILKNRNEAKIMKKDRMEQALIPEERNTRTKIFHLWIYCLAFYGNCCC